VTPRIRDFHSLVVLSVERTFIFAIQGAHTYKKLAVQWLNEALCFVSSLVVADSFRLRNRQLLVAAKR
ncbi:MAG: hypothetical protein ACK5XV_03215, partial [Flavobacteriales bacterium]